jgi:hypothetical protein
LLTASLYRPVVDVSIVELNTMLIYRMMYMVEGKSFNCEACGVSFSTHEALVDHNVNSHGAAIGTQLRQSEEIKKQRAEE